MKSAWTNVGDEIPIEHVAPMHPDVVVAFKARSSRRYS